ncbi:MAG: cysteine desulfurase [Anaerolineae bacterium]|nr:cysteine desulfurase [Anaerolineae bacterium]
MARRMVYLDHSATTPMDPRVLDALLPCFSDVYGNTSSSHSEGRRAERALETARETIAGLLNCKPHEIVFTSGGSESDNMAIRGVAWYARRVQQEVHLVASAVEHPAVGKTMAVTAGELGCTYSLLAVDHYGRVDAEAAAEVIQPSTTLVSVMAVNNEVGTLEPIAQLAALAHSRGVLFHTDAVQAGGQVRLDVQQLNVDLLSLSAHKFYGPKGVGLLYVRDGVNLHPTQTGGSHEGGRRSGTVNTPGIVGMAKALEIAYDGFDEFTAHYRTMRDLLIDEVLTHVPGTILTGHRTERLPSHASFVVDGVEANTLLMHLDTRGVLVSSGSACKTGNPEPSDVLLAMGLSREAALSSVRLTVGRSTTEEDVAYAVEALRASVERARTLPSGGLYDFN